MHRSLHSGQHSWTSNRQSEPTTALFIAMKRSQYSCCDRHPPTVMPVNSDLSFTSDQLKQLQSSNALAILQCSQLATSLSTSERCTMHPSNCLITTSVDSWKYLVMVSKPSFLLQALSTSQQISAFALLLVLMCCKALRPGNHCKQGSGSTGGYQGSSCIGTTSLKKSNLT